MNEGGGERGKGANDVSCDKRGFILVLMIIPKLSWMFFHARL